jgi:hypothetical protein
MRIYRTYNNRYYCRTWRVVVQGDGYEKYYFELFACFVFITADRMPDGDSK